MTTRRQSCGKVMFLHLSVYSLGGVVSYPTDQKPPPPMGPNPPEKYGTRQEVTYPLERTWDQTGSDIIPPESQKRAVRIVLECFLVLTVSSEKARIVSLETVSFIWFLHISYFIRRIQSVSSCKHLNFWSVLSNQL